MDLDGAHGQTIITGGRVNGKSEAKTRIIREPITAEKIQEHFDGGKGIGSIPINANDKCLSMVVLILTPILWIMLILLASVGN